MRYFVARNLLIFTILFVAGLCQNPDPKYSDDDAIGTEVVKVRENHNYVHKIHQFMLHMHCST